MKPMHHAAITYRPEIDGLRALAVLPVILFHAGYDLLSGGFIGVDIFFVISGFLITSILLTEKAAGTFSIKRFYERRVRRIIPALLFVTLACLPLAWFIMLPEELKFFALSLASAATFLSNVFFAVSISYFSPVTEELPLIHTWSLSLEEQYYLVIPLLIALLWRFGRHRLGGVVGALLLASFLLCLHLLDEWPNATFYMLPTRAWELLAGSLLAFVPAERLASLRASRLGAVLASVALVLLLVGMLALDSKTPFPGLYSLIPVLGAVAIIAGAGPTNLAGRLLASRPFVGVGLVSYSAYLWHQPLIAFAALKFGPGHGWEWVLVILSLVFAYVTWRVVEGPFRQGQLKVAGRAIGPLPVAGVALTACFGLSLAVAMNEGFPQRFSPDKQAFMTVNSLSEAGDRYYGIPEAYRADCNFLKVERDGSKTILSDKPRIPDACYRTGPGPSVLLWGDSHVQHLYHGLKGTLDPAVTLNIIGTSGCAPDLEPTGKNSCAASNRWALARMKAHPPTLVVMTQFMGVPLKRFATIAAHLRSLGVKRVLLIGPAPHWRGTLPRIIVTTFWEGRNRLSTIPLKYLDAEAFSRDQAAKAWFAGPPGADGRLAYFSPIDALCTAEGCLANLDASGTRLDMVSYDYGHLTPRASERVARQGLADQVMRLLTP